MTTSTDPFTLDPLRRVVTGRVLAPTDDGYAQRCHPDRFLEVPHPAVVVEPVSVEDVEAAVRYAAAVGMGVAVQATGGWAATSIDGAMLIDTGRLDRVDVDAETWIARIGAGVTWSQVLDVAKPFGLAPLVGTTSHAGAVGSALGGGWGWLARRYGLATDRVRRLEVVTADGERRSACRDHETELFWALCGAGMGSLGVVTAMEIDLVPVSGVSAGSLWYPGEMFAEVAARYRGWIEDTGEDLTSSLALVRMPSEGSVPAGRFTVVRGCATGAAASEKLVDAWRSWRRPVSERWGVTTIGAIDSVSNLDTDPRPSAATADWLTDFDAEVVAAVEAAMDSPVGMLRSVEIMDAAGAVARLGGDSSSYGHRTRRSLLQARAGVGSPGTASEFAELRGHLGRHRSAATALEMIDGPERRSRSRQGFDDDAWPRLQIVKSEIDPDDMFAFGVELERLTRDA